jgi:predicted Fe-S protein YdhL (DUF1289 family)
VNNPSETIVSPCIGVCSMNEASGLCEGCYRTIEEIRDWWDMAPAQRGTVMQRLDQRLQQIDFGD